MPDHIIALHIAQAKGDFAAIESEFEGIEPRGNPVRQGSLSEKAAVQNDDSTAMIWIVRKFKGNVTPSEEEWRHWLSNGREKIVRGYIRLDIQTRSQTDEVVEAHPEWVPDLKPLEILLFHGEKHPVVQKYADAILELECQTPSTTFHMRKEEFCALWRLSQETGNNHLIKPLHTHPDFANSLLREPGGVAWLRQEGCNFVPFKGIDARISPDELDAAFAWFVETTPVSRQKLELGNWLRENTGGVGFLAVATRGYAAGLVDHEELLRATGDRKVCNEWGTPEGAAKFLPPNPEKVSVEMQPLLKINDSFQRQLKSWEKQGIINSIHAIKPRAEVMEADLSLPIFDVAGNPEAQPSIG